MDHFGETHGTSARSFNSIENWTFMDYIDPHIHMVSRTTDDYATLARMGCVAMSEPAFWAGFDRRSVDGFRDYFHQLTDVEPKRAAQFGIQHFTWLCINAKEAENVSLSRDVIAMIPEFIECPNVLGIGEIGLNKNTKNEATVFLEHLELAIKYDQQILIHTPHLADKYQGTKMILDMRSVENHLVKRYRKKSIDYVSSASLKYGRHIFFKNLYKTFRNLIPLIRYSKNIIRT